MDSIFDTQIFISGRQEGARRGNRSFLLVGVGKTNQGDMKGRGKGVMTSLQSVLEKQIRELYIPSSWCW